MAQLQATVRLLELGEDKQEALDVSGDFMDRSLAHDCGHGKNDSWTLAKEVELTFTCYGKLL